MNSTDQALPTSSLDLQITGMTCASCVARVEKTLKKIPGVDSAEVNLATERATVRTVAAVDTADLIAAIEEAGYAARSVPDEAQQDATVPARELPAWWPVALAAALTVPLVIPMIAALFGVDWALNGW